MKIYHIRKLSGQDTDFRKTILNALAATAQYKQNNRCEVNVYIASGFFDDVENFPYNNAVASDLSSELQGIDRVYLIGAYNGRTELMALSNRLTQDGCRTHAYYKWRFHAKIFVITVDGNPIFEIIGSSNMTWAAYCGVSRRNNNLFSLNSECDLVIWDDERINVPMEPSRTTMALRYESDDNNGITLEEHMHDILKILGDVIDYPNEL